MVLCWTILPRAAPAQTPFPRFEKIHRAQFPPEISQRASDTSVGIDVVHYGLNLTLPLTDQSLRGRNVITLVLRSPADSVTLNAAKLAFDTVQVDGLIRPFTTDTTREEFTVFLGRTRPAGDTLQLTVVYYFDPALHRSTFRQGYYFFDVDIGLPAPLGYTMSEPSDARFWMPCNDDPRDKATVDVRTTVPAGYVAASNGRLLGVNDNGNGTATWHWRELHQIAPYLICVTASRFTISTLHYARAPGDTLPLHYYVWSEDSLECAQYLPTVQAMVASLSAVFGPYPFDKYGMTAIVPFGYGGMEHQTLTTLNRFYKTDESVVVHELAHQWWGDLVTCATWPDVWLNESFATYAEALWSESQGGATGLNSTMRSLEHFWYGSWYGAVYDPQGQGFDLFADVVYGKGAWVLHTLRGVIGDSAFFATLRAYRSAFAEGNATTGDFASIVSSVVGKDMSWFFNQWIYGTGWPVYAVTFERFARPFRFTVSQVQSASWPLFRMPLSVRIFHQGRDTTLVVWDTLRTQTFAAALPWIPDSVQLDPDGWVLKELTPTVADRPLPGGFTLQQNYPNPFNPATVIRYTIGGASLRAEQAGNQGSGVSDVMLVVYDVLGREVATLVNERMNPGSYAVTFDGTGLASGVYLYRLVAGPFVATKKLILLH